MSSHAKLRKQAARYEQDRQYDKALEVYARLLAEPGSAEEEHDVALFNRVGDLALRQGDVRLALQHYERAIAVYSAGGLHGNAIALCNKILRHAPDHAPAHYTLGILSARKGFRGNAARHLTDYADRMLATGRSDEALKGLREFVDIAGNGDDPFDALEHEIAHPSRTEDAAERLRELVGQLRASRPDAATRSADSTGRGADAGASAPRASTDLVFLDVYDDTPATAPVAGFESTSWDAPADDPVSSAELDGPTALESLPVLDLDDVPGATEPAVRAAAPGADAPLADAPPLEEEAAPDARPTSLPGELPPLRLADGDAARVRHAAAHAASAAPAAARGGAALLDVPDLEPPTHAAPAEPRARADAAATVSDEEYVDLASWLAEDDGPKTTRMTAGESFETGDEEGDFGRMLSTFRDGVARTLDVDDFQGHYDMGLAYRGMGLMDDAIAEFQKAVRAPNRPLRTVEALGECFIEKGEPQVALTVLERGLADTPADAPTDDALLGVLYFLGRAHEAMDRRDDALRFYQRVLATDIQFRDAAERLAQLTRT